MIYRLLIPCLLMGIFGSFSAPVYATNDGHLDNVWLSGRITTIIPKAINSGSEPWEQLKNVKIDSGMKNCYAQLKWGGNGSFIYQLVAYCLNGNGEWERGEYNSELWELNDSKQSIGTDWGSLYFAQQGKVFHGFPNDYAFTGYDGTIILTPSFDNKGNLRSISASVNSGLIYAWDAGTKIGGTSRSGGLKLRFVKTESVPQGAIDCAGATTPLCTETNN